MQPLVAAAAAAAIYTFTPKQEGALLLTANGENYLPRLMSFFTPQNRKVLIIFAANHSLCIDDRDHYSTLYLIRYVLPAIISD